MLCSAQAASTRRVPWPPLAHPRAASWFAMQRKVGLHAACATADARARARWPLVVDVYAAEPPHEVWRAPLQKGTSCGKAWATPRRLCCAARHHGGGSNRPYGLPAAAAATSDRLLRPTAWCRCWLEAGRRQQMGYGLRNVRFESRMQSRVRRVEVPVKQQYECPLSLLSHCSLHGARSLARATGQAAAARGSHYSGCAWYCCRGRRWVGPTRPPALPPAQWPRRVESPRRMRPAC